MANNFRITGDYYVSKTGIDTNSGTNPESPLRTIQAALNLLTNTGGTKTIVVGSGVYTETINKTRDGVGNFTVLKADGNVVIDFANYYTFYNYVSNTGWYLYDFTIKNCPIFNCVNLIFTDCKFQNCYFSNTTGNIALFYASYCTFINCNFNFPFLSNSLGPQISNSILINSKCYVPILNNFINNYIDNTSLVSVNSNITPVNFNYNNIQGSVVMNFASNITSGIIQDNYGRYYDLSLSGFGGSGTILDPYKRNNTASSSFGFNSHRVAYPTYNASSSAVNPKFNGVESGDFTLQADSYNIKRGSTGVNIGGTNYALSNNSNENVFSGSGVVADKNLVLYTDSYILSGSELTGSLISDIFGINSAGVPKLIQKISYVGLLAFNKDINLFSGSNFNVPDSDTFTSASLNSGSNPDRLVFYMRHTTGSDIPVSDAGWDNGGLWSAGEYNVFEWNRKPIIDAFGVGNGSEFFNSSSFSSSIAATYVQMKIKLRNNYLL